MNRVGHTSFLPRLIIYWRASKCPRVKKGVEILVDTFKEFDREDTRMHGRVIIEGVSSNLLCVCCIIYVTLMKHDIRNVICTTNWDFITVLCKNR
jgi:hypothetical protein